MNKNIFKKLSPAQLDVRNINRRALSKATGINEGYISKILLRINPLSSLTTFKKLSDALGVTMDELLLAIDRAYIRSRIEKEAKREL